MTAAELVAALMRQRVRQCLTQADVAESMGVTPAQVSQMENGKRDPQFGTLVRYADAVGCDLAVVRRRDALPPAPPPRWWRGISRTVHQTRGVPA